ncbi:uncharacterized protein LOC106180161 [Lingula anatina]|uniref:Uncharacterized protein LOC106180161 n=1 Tax=Lingula anatina TaxID=7574 RepID=A0A1S3KA64_LINAN|nr:uncharacterized protein LOC106180161 [Lingula anatina]|eukprot:XP_013419518.1 uncharacterized protein LOC106180161 [Lingula anatina]
MFAEKPWGKRPYWGVGFNYDHQWVLTDKQRELQAKLMELCRTTMRPNAVRYDETYEFPRENLNAMAELGLLGLIAPKDLGGLGENHVCAAMVVETIARYGCPSTAMVYCMHVGAVATLLLRYHNNKLIKSVLQRLNKDKLVGTESFSDPATGGHFWYPLSSKNRYNKDGRFQMLKYASWTTSAGFADFYVVQTISPGFGGDYSDLSIFLLFQDEVRAHADDWKSLGLRGNQSGVLITEGVLSQDRQVGELGEGAAITDEIGDPWFLLLTASCWNGIAFGCIDVACKHATEKDHADTGLRVCDYPTIQDYFGECIIDTNACRAFVFNVAHGMDLATNNNDWTIHSDPKVMPRSDFLHWCWQIKFAAAKNVGHVSDVMLHACGGSGYKTELGIERLLRDGKAGWVMGPSNEVTRQWVGITALMGMEQLDLWSQKTNKRLLNYELKKLKPEVKKELAHKMLRECEQELGQDSGTAPNQDTDFDDPFSTSAALPLGAFKDPAGKVHLAALNADTFTSLKLTEVIQEADKVQRLRFALPDPEAHSGCLPGQYVQARVNVGGKFHERYLSPMSAPSAFGVIEFGLRLETHGAFSIAVKNMKIGDTLECRGPCGGFEYSAGKLDTLTMIATGVGATPAIQLIRSITNDPSDTTKVKFFYHAKTPEQLLCLEELTALGKRDSRFDFTFCVSECDDSWTGTEGLIDASTLKPFLPPANGKTNKTIICTGPAVVITTLSALHELGYKSDGIYIYGPFGVELIRAVYGQKAKLATHLPC